MDSIEIALSKLSVWEGNVRKTGAAEGVEELVASIAAHGLLQPLVVMEARKGKYHVIAGQRRLLALQSLASDGRIEANAIVPCYVTKDNSKATEISLAENVVRVQMHPADQFEAFLKLAEQGSSAETIAARFGVTESVVAKRLKLANVSPVLIAEYRAGKLGLEQIMAFTVSDDHARQEQVWESAQGRSWTIQPGSIRQALTEGEIAATDRRVMFIGLNAYEAAGGTVKRDLFDDQNAGYVNDAGLLNSLVDARLLSLADEIKAEGWKWAETSPTTFDWDYTRKLRRVHANQAPLPPELEAERSKLADEYDRLVEEANGDQDNLTEEQNERIDAIQERLDEIDDRPEVFDDATKAIAGVLIGLDYQGELDIERGWVKPEDDTASAPATIAATAAAAKAQPEEQRGLSAALIEDLTQHRPAAIQAALASNAHVALAAVAHAFALKTFYRYGVADSCLGVSLDCLFMPATQETGATAALKAERDQWADYLPGDPGDLWQWCIEQEDYRLAEVLAVCVAGAVNTVQRKAERPAPTKWESGQQIAKALGLDIGSWWKPTADSYFARVGKPDILAAIVEAKGTTPPGTAQMKKAELAALAEREIEGTGWLPAIMRTKQAAE